MIIVRCDAPGCVAELRNARLDTIGRLALPHPWIAIGGQRSLASCGPAHLIEALKAPPVERAEADRNDAGAFG